MTWADRLPPTAGALLVANEWLDNVPVDVAELTEDGLAAAARRPGVRPGAARPAAGDRPRVAGPVVAGRDAGDRAEIGRPRDDAWAGARPVADARSRRRRSTTPTPATAVPRAGSLTGYRGGRPVPPVPDGSCDLTSHVALDACAVAGEQAGATTSLLTTQRAALQALGVRRAGPRTSRRRPTRRGYLRALGRAGQAGELTDPRRASAASAGWCRASGRGAAAR